MTEVSEGGALGEQNAVAVNALQKRKISHDRIMTEYEQKIRKDSIEAEGTMLALCNDLKRDLVLSAKQTDEETTTRCEEILTQVMNGDLFIEHKHPDPTQAVLPTLQEYLPDADLHPTSATISSSDTPSPYRLTLNRILSAKYQLYTIYRSVISSTKSRLECLVKFTKDVDRDVSQRRQRLEHLLGSMIQALRSVGWADEKRCVVLIQEKGTDINVSMAANSRAISDLIGRLHKRETELEEKLVNVFGSYWSKTLNAMASSCLKWLDARMSSQTYTDPQERGEILNGFFCDILGTDLWMAIKEKRSTEETPAGLLDSVEAALRAVSLRQQNSTMIGSKFQGCAPSGLSGMVQASLVSMFSLVSTLSHGKQDAESAWPLPGGMQRGGWMEHWLPPRQPTRESLQLSCVVDAGHRSKIPSYQYLMEQWKNATHLFTTRLQAVQAEALSKAIYQESLLNLRAANDSTILQADLNAIVDFAPTFPLPGRKPNRGEVHLTDCRGTTLVLTPLAENNGVGVTTTTDGNTTTSTLSYLDVRREVCQWGTIETFSVYSSDAWSGMVNADVAKAECALAVHQFNMSEGQITEADVVTVRSLLDSCGVAHGMEDTGLLAADIAECDALIKQTEHLCSNVLRYYQEPTKRVELTASNENEDSDFEALKRRSLSMVETQFATFKRDSGVFLRVLEQLLQKQTYDVTRCLLASPTSLLAIMAGAEGYLCKAATTLHTTVTNYMEQYLILELDFVDNHAQREASFAGLVNDLQRAPDKHHATERYKDALQVLCAIEVLYCDVKKKKEKSLRALQAEVDDAAATLEKQLAESLCIIPCTIVDGCPVPKEGFSAEGDATEATSAEGLTLVKTTEGLHFLQAKPVTEILFGQEDPHPRPVPTEPAPAKIVWGVQAVVQESPESVPKGKPPAGKKGKEVVPVEEEAAPVEAADSGEADMVRRVEKHTDLLKVDVFKLNASTELILTHLQSVLVDWLHSFVASLRASVVACCTERSAALELWLSERLRQHQRRMPSLASQEFDTRMRELVESEELKLREFSWIGERFTNSVDAVKVSLENHESGFEKEVQQLKAHEAQLPAVTNLPAIVVNRKATEADYASLRKRAKTTTAKLDTLLVKAKAALEREGERYLAEHCRTFENGGLLSPEEVAKNTEAIRAMEKSAADVVDQQRKAVSDAREREQQTILDELASYDKAYDYNHQDLTFLKCLNEALSAAKGGVNVCIAGSLEAERRLETAVCELEDRVKALTSKHQSSSKMYTAKVREVAPSDATSDSQDAIDAVLATKLRKAKVNREAQIQEIPAFHLIHHMDGLSRAIYSRATFLGAAKRTIVFTPIPPHTYFATRKDDIETDVEDRVASKPATEIVEGHVEGFWERVRPPLKAYYSGLGDRAITRPSLIRATEEEQKEVLTQRVQDVGGLLQTHFSTAAPAFKTHVMRVALVAPRVPNEVFCGLYNLAFTFLEGSVGACKEIFDELYTRSTTTRKTHGARVKGCMTNPNNRGVIEETKSSEALRHETCKRILKVFQGVLLREEVAIANAFMKQSAQSATTLFKIFNTLLTPDMISTQGDVVVGTHKSLKRLRIARQRKENSTAPLAAPEAAASKPPPKGGKPPPKAAKDTKQDDKPPTDARTLVQYPGMSLEQSKAFAKYQEENAGIEIADHLGEGVKPPQEPAEPVAKPNIKKGGRATPDKGGAKAAPAAGEVEDVPQKSPILEAPDEMIFKAIIQQRTQASLAMQQNHTDQVAWLNQLFSQLLHSEVVWYQSWEGLIASLMPVDE